MKPKHFLILALSIGVLSSCATTQQALVSTRASFYEVWKACMDSVVDVRFSISSTDPKSGLIVADQAVLHGHGTVSRLNIMVNRSAERHEVKVTLVPPPGTVGGRGTVDAYIKALKMRLPDISASERR